MRVRHLSKTYTPESGEVKALNDVNFELPESGMVFILGKSGSGKSTLLNLVSGLDRADKGSEIETCGIEIVSCSANERDVYRNSSCGFVFQEYNLIPELNVKENIKLSWQLQGNKDNDEIVEKTLQKVELGGYGDRKVTELSGGQKQRVAIARAIIKEPKIIFADEPTGALDEDTGESIFKLLKAIAKDRLVIVVTHDREFAEKYADRIIELANGKIISDSDEGYIATAQEKVEHKKSKLPIKAAAKIGCANFKFHPIRLVATIFLSVIAFTFLGVALASAFNSYENIIYNAMVSDGVVYSAIDSKYDEATSGKKITAEKKRGIEAVVGLSLGVVVTDGAHIDSADNIYDNALPFGIAAITQSIADNYGFSVDGRLPTASGELVVSAFYADIINRLKFKKQKVSDIIGEILAVGEQEYNIVGIIDTHFDSGKFDTLKTTVEYNKLAEAYDITLATSPHSLLYVYGDDGMLGDGYDTIIVKNSVKVVPYISGKDGLRLNNNTIYSAHAYKKIIYGIQMATGILAAVFGVFAVLLLLNFLLQSFADKFFTLGVLKANGCNNVGLFKVFMCEALIIAAIVFVLSCIAIPVVGVCLNARFGIAFFGVYYAVLPIVFVGIVAVTVLACIMPIVKIVHMTPIDVIANSN